MQDILTSEVIASCRAPIATARGLPRQAFTSLEFLHAERERIFGVNWVAALFAAEIPDPGDIAMLDVAGIPLFAARANDGAIGVFHNICPYDGCPVVLGNQERAKQIVAPYHGWRYDLEGRLQAIPHWGGPEETPLDALKAKPGDLANVHVAEWHGVVFVNLSADPMPFESFVAPLNRLLPEYRLDDIELERNRSGRAIVNRYTWDSNWKTVLENTCLNILHEGFVHAAYRASPEVPRVTGAGERDFTTVNDGKLLGFGYAYDKLDDTYGSLGFPHLGLQAGEPPATGYYLALYPSLNISVWANAVELEIVTPASPEKTQIAAANFFDKKAASGPEFSAAREEYSKMFDVFIAEDRSVVEAVQRGRESPVFEQQYFSEFWDQGYYDLTQLVLDDLLT